MKYKLQYWKSKKNNEWFFHIKARNGKIVCQGEGYKRRDGLFKTVHRLFKCELMSFSDITKK